MQVQAPALQDTKIVCGIVIKCPPPTLQCTLRARHAGHPNHAHKRYRAFRFETTVRNFAMNAKDADGRELSFAGCRLKLFAHYQVNGLFDPYPPFPSIIFFQFISETGQEGLGINEGCSVLFRAFQSN